MCNHRHACEAHETLLHSSLPIFARALGLESRSSRALYGAMEERIERSASPSHDIRKPEPASSGGEASDWLRRAGRARRFVWIGIGEVDGSHRWQTTPPVKAAIVCVMSISSGQPLHFGGPRAATILLAPFAMEKLRDFREIPGRTQDTHVGWTVEGSRECRSQHSVGMEPRERLVDYGEIKVRCGSENIEPRK